jgi:cytochrome c oxidase assembly protein subunit 15
MPSSTTRRTLSLPTVGLPAFGWLTRVGVVLLALIVVTGGAVRLTESGLGCPTWPRCSEDSFVTQPEFAAHGWIEFGNRLVTFAVGLLMLAMPLVALRLRERRTDLVLLSFGLWLGFVGQIVLGGLTVLFHLHPALVAGHFLLSMLLLVDVVVLDKRAHQDAGQVPELRVPGLPRARRARQGAGQVRRPGGHRELMWLARLTTVVAAVALVLGTVVTGTGPHSGDTSKVRRFGFDIANVAQLHADTAMVLVGLTVALVFAVRLAGATVEARRMSMLLVAAVLAQAGIGFTQYFTGVPVALVELHIAGATTMWVVTLRLWLATTHRPPLPRHGTDPAEKADVAAASSASEVQPPATLTDDLKLSPTAP